MMKRNRMQLAKKKKESKKVLGEWVLIVKVGSWAVNSISLWLRDQLSVQSMIVYLTSNHHHLVDSHSFPGVTSLNSIEPMQSPEHPIYKMSPIISHCTLIIVESS